VIRGKAYEENEHSKNMLANLPFTKKGRLDKRDRITY
jgi:hypothetical protein